ncbi:hypothetical protein FA15DRAFT_588034, partial [Coprinopsis marcescibilis]
GMQVFVNISGLFYYFESSQATKRARKKYVALSVVILVLSIISITQDLISVQAAFFPDPRNPFVQNGPTQWVSLLGDVLGYAAITLGDLLLLYRCYIIWTDRKWVIIFPGILSLAFLALGIATGVQTKPRKSVNIGIASAWYLTSAAFHVLVTSLIVGRLLYIRYRIAKLCDVENNHMYTGPVAILVESALPLAVAGIIAAVLNLPRPSPESEHGPASVVFTAIWGSLCVRSAVVTSL